MFDQGMPSISADYGSTIYLPEAEKMGYKCIWTLDGKDVDTYNYIVTGPCKFVARFEPQVFFVFIDYMSDDGGFSKNIKKGYETYDVDYMVGANDIEGYTFDHWERVINRHDVIAFQDKNYSTSKTIIYRNICNANGNCYYYCTTALTAIYKKNCVAEGSLITLADGTQKAVEDLTGSEQLLVWNLFTGTFDTAPILFIEHDPVREYEVISLMFSDGTTVKVISEHGFWDFDLNEYVFLRSDAAKYIGHWFNKQTTNENGNFSYTRVQLTNVIVQNGFTSAWSPVTYGHLCYYVNGMLSMPGATTGLINIFNVDTDTMKIDETKFNEDIAEYGLFTYEEFAAIIPVPEVVFEAFGGKYFKVAIGKGILSWDMINALVVRYSEFFEEM